MFWNAALDTHVIRSQSRPQGVLVAFFNKAYFYVVNLLLIVYGQHQRLTVGVYGGVTHQKGPILAQTEQFRHVLVNLLASPHIRRLSATVFARCKACSASALPQPPMYHSSLQHRCKTPDRSVKMCSAAHQLFQPVICMHLLWFLQGTKVMAVFIALRPLMLKVLH